MNQIIHGQLLLVFAGNVKYDPTLMHHDQSVAVIDGILHVMSDHHGGQMIFINQLLRYFKDFCRRFGVKSGGVFVQQQDLRLFDGSHQ